MDDFTPAKPRQGTAIFPVPSDVPKLSQSDSYNYYFKRFNGHSSHSFAYRDSQGEILGYILRWNDVIQKDCGIRKEIRPFVYCNFTGDEQKWNSQGFPEPRPLFNLDKLIQRHESKVLICEGEKTALAAEVIFPEFVATTAMQGAQSAKKTDYSPLKGRRVIIAMDHDDAGLKYGQAVYDQCNLAGSRSIQFLNNAVFSHYAIHAGIAVKRDQQATLEEGYDLANALIEGWTPSLLQEFENNLEIPLFVAYEDIFPSKEWPEPLPIENELLPVDTFDFSLMPDLLRDFTEDCSFRMQCSPDYIAVSIICMLSSLIGTSCGMRPKRYDDWVETPNLWGIVVGHPSSMKSPAIKQALAPLDKLEEREAKKHQEELNVWKIKDNITQVQKKSAESKIRKAMDNSSLTQEQAFVNYSDQLAEIPKPSCKRYKINDGSVEKVHEALVENPRGLLLYRDELMGLLKGWEKKGKESDRAFYLEAWSGSGSFTHATISRGTIRVENICISIFGGTQPDKLQDYLEESLGGGNDGLLQRFQLLVFPDLLKEWQYVDQVPNHKAQKAFGDLVDQIAQEEFFNEISDLQETKERKCFSFDDEAQLLFVEWFTTLENEKLRGSDDAPIISQHLTKYKKLMPALALIFHIIDIASKQEKTGKVSVEAATRAMAWCDYLEKHARRSYGMALKTAPMELSKKIEAGGLGEKFTLRELYRKGWHLLKDKEKAEEACNCLIANHWLKKVSSIPALGNKTTTEYVVNPKAYKVDKSHE